MNPAREGKLQIEVLTAFIREHSHAPADGVKPAQWPLPDVQATVAVVRRRKAEHDIRAIDLRNADLTGADLTGADLTGADLMGADLTDAHLGRAHLGGADLGGADLGGADLNGAVLTGPVLGPVRLDGADLTGAKWPEGVPAPGGWMVDSDGQLTRVGELSEVMTRYP